MTVSANPGEKINCPYCKSEHVIPGAVAVAENGDAFAYDASKHHIEHRGGGKWYVMAGEKKVHGPLKKKEAKALEALGE